MIDRRRGGALVKMKVTLRFFYASLLYVVLMIALNFYATWSIVKELQSFAPETTGWQLNFIIAQISIIIAVLILLFSLIFMLHRSIGPLPRLEQTLERVVQGEYSLRVSVRKGDYTHSLVNKINQLLEILEREAKK